MTDHELPKGKLYECIVKADQGDLQAMYDVLSLVTADEITIENTDRDIKERMVSYAQKLIDSDDPAGLYYMALFCRDGDMLARDSLKAVKLFIRMGDMGEHFGYEMAGQMYFSGDGVEQDYQKAFELLNKNDPETIMAESAYMLAEMYRQGHGTEQNLDEANVLYIKELMEIPDMYNTFSEVQKSAGDHLMELYARSQYWVADSFTKGKGGLDKDLETAEDLLEEAAVIAESEPAGNEVYGVTKEMILQRLNEVKQLREE